MISGRRNKCVMRDGNSPTSPSTSLPKKTSIMPHGEFIDRIRKSFYFGANTLAEEMQVSRPLAEYASELFSEPHRGHSLSRLHSIAAGRVHATPCSLIMALVYLDRLNQLDPCYARRITPQELFIVSMMISTKFYAGYDEEIYLSDWAEDGDMTTKRLQQLELEFLCAMEWNLYISNEQFFAKLDSIEQTLARREGLRRGWLTYGELLHMLPSLAFVRYSNIQNKHSRPLLQRLVQLYSKIFEFLYAVRCVLGSITLMAVSYAAGVMTIAGAFLLASQVPGHVLYRRAATSPVRVGDPLLEAANMLPTILPTNVAERLDDLDVDQIEEIDVELAMHVDMGQRFVELRRNVQRRNATLKYTKTATTLSTTTLTDPTLLNVEAELLKLERLYRQEAAADALLRRQNEIATESRLTLPDAAPLQQQCTPHGRAFEPPTHTTQLHRNWLSNKGDTSTTYVDAIKTDCVTNNWRNRTSNAWWQLLNDVAQQTLVRLPLVWFKFI